MPQRLVEIVVPEECREELLSLLDGWAVQGRWYEEIGEGRVLVRVLADSEETERILDGVAGRFSGHEEFRALLLPVEASLPQPEEEPQAPDMPEEAPPRRVRVGRISREELFADLADGARVSPVYIATVALSAVVAAIGLMRDDVAAIIGAMVIAPLLRPNMALSLATTLADAKLARGALLANLSGLLTAIGVSGIMGFLFAVDPAGEQIVQRSHVGTMEILLALAAGAAGALAVTTGIQVSLVGVMVAVALLPPLVSVGLLVGSAEMGMAWRAGLLVLVNVISVNLAGVGVFLLQGIHPRTWGEADRARKVTWIALATWILLLAALVLLVRLAA